MSIEPAELNRGQRKHTGVSGLGAQPYRRSILSLAKNSDFLCAHDIPSVYVSKDKEEADPVLEHWIAKANRELATLLRDMHSMPDSEPASTQDLHRIMTRAVRCALKQYLLQAELGNLALTDELTGLYNRRGFLALAERQLKLARRSGREMLLAFVDVDGLKAINDSLGHSEGDRTLIRTAEVLEETFRDSDILARFGGDEFVVVVVEASRRDEVAIRTRLLENLGRRNACESRCAISLSLGVARFDPRSRTSIGQLMLQADEIMYEDKRRRSKSWECAAHATSGCGR